MLPRDLKAEQFAGYPPEARKLVESHLIAIRQLPLSFVPSLLREVIDYDFRFPAERTAIDRELANLDSLSPAQLTDWFHAFAHVNISSKLERSNWISQPAQFVEQLSEHLWATHQLDVFRKAATDYGDRLRSVITLEAPPVARLGIVVIGKGVATYNGPLFRNLRQHGTYFGTVMPDNGLELLLKAVDTRAKDHPSPYGHWYIDGGVEAEHSKLLSTVSYHSLAPVRAALLSTIQSETSRPGMGPEELRTHMAQLVPSELGMPETGDMVMNRFQLKLLTEGSGTQIFSTTFAQWAAREVLRRAQPITLLVRYAPRQRQKPMSELMSNSQDTVDLDLVGSLVDADMGAYYTWLNLQRLSASDKTSFLAWFEGHSQAIAISPSMPRGTQSTSAVSLGEILTWITD